MKKIVITGLGVLTPVGNNKNDFWNNLQTGKPGTDLITRFDTEKFKTKFANEIKGFYPLNFFDKKEVRKLDRFSQYGLAAVHEAVEDATLDFTKLDTDNIGVIWSSGIGGFETFEEEIKLQQNNNDAPRFNPFFITKIIANGTAGLISIKYNLRGVSYAPVSACSSSAQAIIQACNYIKLGKAEIVITGGSEAPITPAGIGGFNCMKALSTNNENYVEACRPFDVLRDGFVAGEGAGAVIVESLDSALKRNAKIYCEIAGGGEASDAYHITNTHPDGTGAFLAMERAIKDGGITASEIDYINAHATSTPPGDLSEIYAIQRLFKNNIKKLHVSATKSMTGHLLGAAGAVETAATALAVQNNVIPPTINTKVVEDKISKELNLCLENKINKEIYYAISNSFGFGGHCASLVLKKYDA